MPVATVDWEGGVDGRMTIVDQTLLPNEFKIIPLTTVEDAWEAIKVLRVRGAPAIGVAAAFATVLGVRGSAAKDFAGFRADLEKATDYLASSRPTAVNLFWALDRMKRVADESADLGVGELKRRLLAEARVILDEDKATCRAIGRNGAPLIEDGDGVLTHCNAGGLATADYGTALAVMFAAHERGTKFHVYADETRPLLQGARLTTWELMRAGIPVTLICDNMAAQVMKERRVQKIVVGADRIAANGDAANKIGTYGVAVAAHFHGIPFYVAAPVSTFDLTLESGAGIPIEERDPAEITEGFGRRTAPEGCPAYCPAFDVTPHELITGIITERGIIERPDAASVREAIVAVGDQAKREGAH